MTTNYAFYIDDRGMLKVRRNAPARAVQDMQPVQEIIAPRLTSAPKKIKVARRKGKAVTANSYPYPDWVIVTKAVERNEEA